MHRPSAWVIFLVVSPCANICQEAQDDRFRSGVAFFALAMILLVVLLKSEVPTAYRLFVALPLYIAAHRVFEGLYKA